MLRGSWRPPVCSFRAGGRAADTDGRLSAPQFSVDVKVLFQPAHSLNTDVPFGWDLMEKREIFTELDEEKKGLQEEEQARGNLCTVWLWRGCPLLDTLGKCSETIWTLSTLFNMAFPSSRPARLVDCLPAASKTPRCQSTCYYLHLMSFNDSQHQQCFVVSCNHRKPQAYKSAGLIVSPQVTVSVYANTLIYSRKLDSYSFTLRSLISSSKARKWMQAEE